MTSVVWPPIVCFFFHIFNLSTDTFFLDLSVHNATVTTLQGVGCKEWDIGKWAKRCDCHLAHYCIFFPYILFTFFLDLSATMYDATVTTSQGVGYRLAGQTTQLLFNPLLYVFLKKYSIY